MMETSTLLSAPEWAEQTFGEADLGHRSREARAVRMAAAMANDPAAALPKQMGSEAAAHAAYRFLQSAQVSYEDLISPHLEQTRAQMRQAKQMLLIQDTTEVDYEQHPTTTGLGPIGNGSHHGYLLQSVLAIDPASRGVLGLAHQEPFLRQPVPKGENRRQREARERESQVWERSVQAIGPPPAGVQWIHVGDRYSDMFPFLSLCRQQQTDFVVRAAQDRCVDLQVEHADAPVIKRSHHQRPGDQEPPSAPLHLFAVVRAWSAAGEQDLELAATKQNKARTAHLLISFGSVRLLPPDSQPNRALSPLVVWVVRVWEPEPPEGIEPLEWVLLTSVPTLTVEHAWERVDWYRARWIVEDYHQGLKTGCRIEQRQLQTYDGLRRLLGLLSPLAVRLLQVRAASRQNPEQPAVQVLPVEVVVVVAAKLGLSATGLTAQQCWYAIARLGGYLARKGDGPPGWKTLWRGWLQVQTLLDGVHLAARLSLDFSSDP